MKKKLAFTLSIGMLLVAFIPFVGLGIVLYASSNALKNTNKITFTDQAKRKIADLATLLAQKSDFIFENTENYNLILKNIIENMENNPNEYKILYDPNEYMVESKGAYTATLPIDRLDKSDIWVPNTVYISQEIKNKIGLSKNLDPLYKSIITSNNQLERAYVVYNNGFSRTYPYANYSANLDRGNYDMTQDVNAYLIVTPDNNPEKKIRWSKAYMDDWGSGEMISCIIPLYNKDSNFFGIHGIDLTLKNIINYILETKIYKSGYALLIDNEGDLIACPPTSDFNNKEKQRNLLHDSVIGDLVKDALKGKSVSQQVMLGGELKHVVFSQTNVTKWLVGIIVPVSEMGYPFKRLTQDAKVRIKKYHITSVRYVIIILCIVLVFLFFIVRHYATKISRPIKNINVFANMISRGVLHTKLKIKADNIEISELVDSFINMQSSLKNIISTIDKNSRSLTNNATDTERFSTQIYTNIQSISKLMQQIVYNANQERVQIDAISSQITSCLDQAKVSLEQSNIGMDKATNISETIQHQSIMAQKSMKELVFISKGTDQIFEIMENFKEQAKNINKATFQLNKITDKTIYLALNASIEATRSGKEGKGFTIVAQEVKKLADQVSSHTQVINQTIELLNKKVSEQEENKQKFASQLKTSSQIILESLKPITKMADEILTLADINTKTSNLSVGIHKTIETTVGNLQAILKLAEENNSSIRKISLNLDQNTNSVQQLHQMTENILYVAKELNKAEQKFQL